MLRNVRGLFYKTDGGDGGTGAGAVPEQRKAEGAVVDQVHSHEERLQRIEKPFFDRLFAAAEKPSTPPAGTTPPATPGVKTPTKAKSVLDELGEVMDPFGLFDETPVATAPAKTPEAPVSDEAAA
jgi:hypothetical protein